MNHTTSAALRAPRSTGAPRPKHLVLTLHGTAVPPGTERAFGSLNLGRQFAAGYVTMLKADPFLGTAGQMNNIIEPSGFRLNSSARYATPVYAGFGASVDVALGEVTGNWRAGRETGGSLDCDLGDAHAHVIHCKLDKANGAGSAKQNLMLAGTHDFGFVKFHALVQKTTGAPTGKARLDALAYDF